MKAKITSAICAILTLGLLSGCQSEKLAAQARVPFEEASRLDCPPQTSRIEKRSSMFPEFFCVGDHGRQGPWLEFDPHGNLKTQAFFVDDKLTGPWIAYHIGGAIEQQGEMRQNMRQGKWTQWYVDGTLRSEKHFVNGEQHGSVTLYYRNGVIMAQGDYVNDLEEGPWKVYTPEGKLARECRLDRGDEKDCVVHIRDFNTKSGNLHPRPIAGDGS